MTIKNTILNCLTAALLSLGLLSEAHAQRLNFNSLLQGSQLLAPATFRLSAYAVAASGKTIQKVEFFNGNTLLGVATLTTGDIHTLDVLGQGGGSYSIKAKSIDNTGTTKTTGAITLSVRVGKSYGSPGNITPVPLYTTSAPYGYNEYLPNGYDENYMVKKWPLGIDLHGRGGIPGINGTTGQVQIDQLVTALDGSYTNIKMDGINFPAVLLQPQSGAVNNKEWDSVDGFIVYALSQYNVDPNRVYLTGQSYGANRGALTYAGGVTNKSNNALRLAALFPMCGGQFNATKTQVDRMANLPIWLFTSWGDNVGGSIGAINTLNYAAGVTPYNDTTNPPSALRDLLFSFSVVGKETFDGGVAVTTTTVDPAVVDSMTVPKFIPLSGDKIDAMRTVSYVNNSWKWNTDYQRDPGSKFMLTLLPGYTHTIWNTTHAVGDLWTWFFLQSRSPAARSIFAVARLNTTRAIVNQACADTLAPKVTAPRGASFIRDVKGPSWLKVASDGTLSGTPGVADLGINTWDITVTTTNTKNVPITESAELLLFVEAPGDNEWWQKQNGDTALGIPAIDSGPAGDDDGDGLSNLFEYVTNSDTLQSVSDPRLPGASFKVSIAPVSGNPSQMQITYGPLIKGQTYTVRSTDSLSSGTWASDNMFTPNSAMTTKVVTVTNASMLTRFYAVEINKPQGRTI
jgi:hypothetical protein